MFLQTYLVAAPEEYQAASPFCRGFAHAAYRIGSDSTLLRQNLLLQTRGGLLCISDCDAPVIPDAEKLCAAAARECGRRSYTGVFLDFEQPLSPDRLSFALQLARQCAAARRPLYVTERCGRAIPSAISLIGTAISGGNFTQYLQESAAAHGGAGRTALDVQRLRMEFTLPSRTGQGKPLSAQELKQLLEQEQPAVFFSEDLCARYFTYRREDDTRFVLFDDAETISRKLRLGTDLGFAAAFLLWAEIQDIAGGIRGLR